MTTATALPLAPGSITDALRIAVIGNQGNAGYRIAKWLRECVGPVDLYRVPDRNHERSLPESVDRALLVDGYPDWIKEYVPRRACYSPEANDVSRRISCEYDLAFTNGAEGLCAAAQVEGIPVLHLSIGGDVNTIPFWPDDDRQPQPRRALARTVRRGLEKTTLILENFVPSMEALHRLGYGDRWLLWSIPEDVGGNRARVDEALLAELDAKYAGHHRVFMFLTRIEFKDPADPSYKGPEHFAAALARMIGEGRDDVRALIADHGSDAGEFKGLVRELGLDRYVEYVPHLPYWKLLTYLAARRAVVLDEINPSMGELSGMAREALSVGAVVLKKIDPQLTLAAWGPGYPYPSIECAESCYRQLVHLYDMPDDDLAALQQAGLAWARRCLDYRHHMPKLHEHMAQAWFRYHIDRRLRGGRER